MDSEFERDAVRELVAYLEKPAPRKWIAGRVLTILSQYFAPNMDEAVSKAIADDWCEMLAGYPAWAIANACRWWMSRENQHKARRPLPGDIQEAAYREMERVRAAKITVSRGLRVNVPDQPERHRVSDPDELARRRKVSEEVMGELKRMQK